MISIYDISKIRTQTQTHLFVNHLISILIVSLLKWLISSRKQNLWTEKIDEFVYIVLYNFFFFFIIRMGSPKSLLTDRKKIILFSIKNKKKALCIVLNNRISECAWMSQKYSNCIEFSSKEEILWTISW